MEERFREVRTVFHLSQREMADRIGISPQLVSQMESGKARVSVLTAKAVESEFGVSAEWLRGGIGEMLPERGELSRDLTEILNYYPAVVQVINGLAGYMTLSGWQSLNELCIRMIRERPEIYGGERIRQNCPDQELTESNP